MKKKTYRTTKEKAKIALACLRNDKTLRELSKEYKVHSTQLGQWRNQLVEYSHELFEKGRRSPAESLEQQEEIKSLYEIIGRLKVENDFLKKKITS